MNCGFQDHQYALIRSNFSSLTRDSILVAARLQLVLSALSGPRYLGITALIAHFAFIAQLKNHAPALFLHCSKTLHV